MTLSTKHDFITSMKEIDLYLQGNSIPEISKKTGTPLSTIRFRLKRAGVLRTRADSIRLAAMQGKLSSRKGTKRVFSDEWKANIREARIRHGEEAAKGVSKKPNGYIEFTRGPNKGRRQHVVIMEEHIGRRLHRNECVHHINGVRDDNRIENLALMTVSEHSRHHALERVHNRNSKGKFVCQLIE